MKKLMGPRDRLEDAAEGISIRIIVTDEKKQETVEKKCKKVDFFA